MITARALILAENRRMLSMCRELGFAIEHEVDDPASASLRSNPRANTEANE